MIVTEGKYLLVSIEEPEETIEKEKEKPSLVVNFKYKSDNNTLLVESKIRKLARGSDSCLKNEDYCKFDDECCSKCCSECTHDNIGYYCICVDKERVNGKCDCDGMPDGWQGCRKQ